MAATIGNDSEFDIEVADANELSNKSRIRDLLSRRQEVLDARNDARAEMQVNGGDQVAALEIYHTYLTGFIMDLWTKFVETRAGMQLLQEQKIHDFKIHPPQEELDKFKSANGVQPPEPEPVVINGLNWFLQQNSVVVSATFELQTWDPPGTTKIEAQQPIPWAALDRAFIACQEYMNEIGVDADLHLDNYTGEDGPGV